MSAPVGRETPARKAVTTARRVASLAKRPAGAPADPHFVDYMIYQSANVLTGTGGSYVPVPLTAVSGPNNPDHITLNGDDNIELVDHGLFEFLVGLRGPVSFATGDTIYSRIVCTTGNWFSGFALAGDVQDLQWWTAHANKGYDAMRMMGGVGLSSGMSFPVEVELQLYGENSGGSAKAIEIDVIVAWKWLGRILGDP